MNASVISFLSAFACSVAFAPIVALVARRIGMVDRPDGQRKLHSRIVPLTGGPVVLISLFVGLGTTLWIHPTLLQATAGDIRFLVSLAIAGILIVMWPDAALFVFAIFFGVQLIFSGFRMCAIGSRIHRFSASHHS